MNSFCKSGKSEYFIESKEIAKVIINGKNISVKYIKNAKKNINSNVYYALNPLDIEIAQSKVTVIFGRSGSGKTTLLSVLAGLQRPSQGTVLYDGTDIYKEKDDDFSLFRNENIGFIPQGQSLIGNLSVRENILLQAGISKDGSDKTIKADDLLEELGLLDRADFFPKELSGGELRRCAIARALINDPKVIYADEPTGDLDDHNTKKVFELLKKKAGEGAAVVIVTHDMAALPYADIIYKMDAGSLKISA